MPELRSVHVSAPPELREVSLRRSTGADHQLGTTGFTSIDEHD
ncbi:MAG TPA: hypothetical protein VFR47_10080 [Anaerolineales bacterium]|nr:hypothetical protein [Anaerolineales bacterium]